jgi:hypothetical protein
LTRGMKPAGVQKMPETFLMASHGAPSKLSRRSWPCP